MLATGKRVLTWIIRPETLARLATPVTLLLVVALAHELAELTWRLIPSPSYALPPVIQITQTVPVDAVPADYTAIADWHLFGRVKMAESTPLPPVEKAPETRLALRLAGVFYRSSANALAMIAEAGGEERSYRVGDQLPGGARLERILLDQVVLSRNARLETLSMPRDTMVKTLSVPTTRQPAVTPLSANNARTVAAGAIARDLRTAVATRPEALQDLAFASPYMENGRFVGFRLRPGRKRKLLGQLGLQSGDVITAINGTTLQSPAQGFTLLQDMLQGDQVTARVLRNGAEITFTFNLTGQ